jgi:hypothetical protein
VLLITRTYRCPAELCRESCERDARGEWVHEATGTPACGDPEEIEVEPSRVGWSGRTWRMYEARERAARKAAAEARRLVESLPPPMRHCGECDISLRIAIEGVMSSAFEDGLAYALDEFVRSHPAEIVPATVS